MQPFPLIPRVRQRVADLGQEFLAEFYGSVTARQPSNVDALGELAHALTRLGRLEEGLVIDRRLVRLVPENPIVHYNLACSLALLERGDEAIDALERAVELGYEDSEHLLGDADLAGLHEDERFQRLVRRVGGEISSL